MRGVPKIRFTHFKVHRIKIMVFRGRGVYWGHCVSGN